MADWFVAVAGGIAAGKTGLVERLAAAIGAEPLREKVSANPFFDRFYEDPGRWAFHSQTAFAAEALARQARAGEQGAVVQDRTVYETVEVFGRHLAQLGHINAEELRVLLDLSSSALLLPRQPSAMIYLHAPAPTLLRRVAARDRPAERHLSEAYLEALNVRYEEFIAAWTRCPVLSVDTTTRDLRLPAELERLVEELELLEDNR